MSNVTTLVDSLKQEPHSPPESDVPSSPSKELRREEEKDEEEEMQNLHEKLQEEVGFDGLDSFSIRRRSSC